MLCGIKHFTSERLLLYVVYMYVCRYIWYVYFQPNSLFYLAMHIDIEFFIHKNQLSQVEAAAYFFFNFIIADIWFEVAICWSQQKLTALTHTPSTFFSLRKSVSVFVNSLKIMKKNRAPFSGLH